ncbi:putative secreted protein [Eutypa lata UCREL1]|uniref:Putative secreted protein n=1 Tax=Eutypa lata (strain UCR-EL1) TaxID=1287681 RepID=M7T729_EUTLA|nr:putative secreted protein [Eutypa lata UCREL1]
MRFFLATVLAFMVAQFVAAGSTSPSSLQLPNGYTEVQSFITFHGRVVDGGQNVTLKGTVEQIVAQIKRVNPTYFARNSTIKASDHDESKAEAGKSTLFCNLPDGAPGYIEPIEEAIQYLGALNGYCGASPGPGACGRISCSYQSAIW